jgi:4-carboxymuconolactone decarboxylase
LSDPTPAGGRLPLLTPAGLDEEQREVYDAIASGPRARGPFRLVDDQGRLLGPFNAMVHAPAVGGPLQELGQALRFSGELPDRTRELLICAVAAHWRSDFEWYAHSRAGLRAGLTEEELEAVAQGLPPTGLGPAEQAALALALALLRERAVSAALYDEARAHLGHAGVVELAVLVGYYQTLAGLLGTADVPAPEDDDRPPSWPPT